jgi:hypothetical protein
LFDASPSYGRWDVFVLAESLTDLWTKEEVVYLTAESDNVLTELSDDKIYVIGGEWGWLGCAWALISPFVYCRADRSQPQEGPVSGACAEEGLPAR